MQDPSAAYYQATMKQPQFPEQEQLKCPRCESTNTKFCYYNNYNLSQPRHYCKSCRRYWTRGGTLRNIPVGGGSRKNTKRSGSSSNPKKTHVLRNPDLDPTGMINDSASSAESREPAMEPGQNSTRFCRLSVDDQDMKVLHMSGSFSSLFASDMQRGILDGPKGNGSGLKPVQNSEFGQNYDPGRGSGQDLEIGNRGGGDEAHSWTACSNGWPDLAINPPGSNFR